MQFIMKSACDVYEYLNWYKEIKRQGELKLIIDNLVGCNNNLHILNNKIKFVYKNSEIILSYNEYKNKTTLQLHCNVVYPANNFDNIYNINIIINEINKEFNKVKNIFNVIELVSLKNMIDLSNKVVCLVEIDTKDIIKYADIECLENLFLKINDTYHDLINQICNRELYYNFKNK